MGVLPAGGLIGDADNHQLVIGRTKRPVSDHPVQVVNTLDNVHMDNLNNKPSPTRSNPAEGKSNPKPSSARPKSASKARSRSPHSRPKGRMKCSYCRSAEHGYSTAGDCPVENYVLWMRKANSKACIFCHAADHSMIYRHDCPQYVELMDFIKAQEGLPDLERAHYGLACKFCVNEDHFFGAEVPCPAFRAEIVRLDGLIAEAEENAIGRSGHPMPKDVAFGPFKPAAPVAAPQIPPVPNIAVVGPAAVLEPEVKISAVQKALNAASDKHAISDGSLFIHRTHAEQTLEAATRNLIGNTYFINDNFTPLKDFNWLRQDADKEIIDEVALFTTSLFITRIAMNPIFRLAKTALKHSNSILTAQVKTPPPVIVLSRMDNVMLDSVSKYAEVRPIFVRFFEPVRPILKRAAAVFKREIGDFVSKHNPIPVILDGVVKKIDAFKCSLPGPMKEIFFPTPTITERVSDVFTSIDVELPTLPVPSDDFKTEVLEVIKRPFRILLWTVRPILIISCLYASYRIWRLFSWLYALPYSHSHQAIIREYNVLPDVVRPVDDIDVRADISSLAEIRHADAASMRVVVSTHQIVMSTDLRGVEFYKKMFSECLKDMTNHFLARHRLRFAGACVCAQYDLTCNCNELFQSHVGATHVAEPAIISMELLSQILASKNHDPTKTYSQMFESFKILAGRIHSVNLSRYQNIDDVTIVSTSMLAAVVAQHHARRSRRQFQMPDMSEPALK